MTNDTKQSGQPAGQHASTMATFAGVAIAAQAAAQMRPRNEGDADLVETAADEQLEEADLDSENGAEEQPTSQLPQTPLRASSFQIGFNLAGGADEAAVKKTFLNTDGANEELWHWVLSNGSIISYSKPTIKFVFESKKYYSYKEGVKIATTLMAATATCDTPMPAAAIDSATAESQETEATSAGPADGSAPPATPTEETKLNSAEEVRSSFVRTNALQQLSLLAAIAGSASRSACEISPVVRHQAVGCLQQG